jgi:hypothetical protein
MGTSRFWFESLQNWQSEFLSIGLMVVLTIWLRQKGSPESKPVDAPHDRPATSRAKDSQWARTSFKRRGRQL